MTDSMSGLDSILAMKPVGYEAGLGKSQAHGTDSPSCRRSLTVKVSGVGCPTEAGMVVSGGELTGLVTAGAEGERDTASHVLHS